MNLNKIFQNEKERQIAKEHLLSLKDNPSWKFIVEKIIKVDIDRISDIILSDFSDDFEKIKDLKRQRAYWIILSELPNTILKELEVEKMEETLFDPYYTTEQLKKEKGR